MPYIYHQVGKRKYITHYDYNKVEIRVQTEDTLMHKNEIHICGEASGFTLKNSFEGFEGRQRRTAYQTTVLYHVLGEISVSRLWGRMSFLRRYVLTYLRMKCPDSCNLSSKGSERGGSDKANTAKATGTQALMNFSCDFLIHV